MEIRTQVRDAERESPHDQQKRQDCRPNRQGSDQRLTDASRENNRTEKAHREHGRKSAETKQCHVPGSVYGASSGDGGSQRDIDQSTRKQSVQETDTEHTEDRVFAEKRAPSQPKSVEETRRDESASVHTANDPGQ